MLLHQIIGSLGCSLEVVEIIQRVNRMRAAFILHESQLTDDLQDVLVQQRIALDKRLQTLSQTIHPDEDANITPLRRIRVLSTADLYRLAAWLYLLRVIPLHEDEAARTSLLSAALGDLDKLDVATSPWPLFVIACESVEDSARVLILRVLDKMEAVRGIGNVRVMRGIVEAFWKQVDLKADAGLNVGANGVGIYAQQPYARWWDMVNCDPAVPWFI